MRISDWSSDVCSSDLSPRQRHAGPDGNDHRRIRRTRQAARDRYRAAPAEALRHLRRSIQPGVANADRCRRVRDLPRARSEEHTSELQSLMRISYAVFCLNKKKKHTKL